MYMDIYAVLDTQIWYLCLCHMRFVSLYGLIFMLLDNKYDIKLVSLKSSIMDILLAQKKVEQNFLTAWKPYRKYLFVKRYLKLTHFI